MTMFAIYAFPANELWSVSPIILHEAPLRQPADAQRVQRSELHVPPALPLQVVRALRASLLLPHPFWPL